MIYGCIASSAGHLFLLSLLLFSSCTAAQQVSSRIPRERTSLNSGWRFLRSATNNDKLAYDRQPNASSRDGIVALKSWVLPSGNDFIKDQAKQHRLPAGAAPSPSIAQGSFNDTAWESVDLPHDWAIKGPFYNGANAVIGGGMGRLPVQGVGWYRKALRVGSADLAEGRSVYLDIDGAMSYSTVWVNGNLVGGWPYGYSSFRLELTHYLTSGDNQLAIRLEVPVDSSRWYPGAGIYRNVWLTKVGSTHVSQWGTFVTTRNVSSQSATVDMVAEIENAGTVVQQVQMITDIHVRDPATGRAADKVASLTSNPIKVPASQRASMNGSAAISFPQLWSPKHPNMYIAVTKLLDGNNSTIDIYETYFGIRSVIYDATKGLLVNGGPIRIQGVNQHHDLGALGAAFNVRAARRQLEMLQDLGCNAIRMAHNPPAPELLDLADQMGFMVIDEVFDCWEREKNSNDYHLIFSDWHEPILRSFIRRDRNHPSIIIWSFGNEVGEQYTDTAGAAIGHRLHDMVHEEDPTRPTMASMNYAKPDMPLPQALDIISLNYQGEGIRDSPAYAGLDGIKTAPLYPDFHKKFPAKLILSSETAAALSTRGTYFFPVTNESSAPVSDNPGGGGNSKAMQVSAYELYTAPFGASPDKVFATQDRNPYVAGEFVWSGWDYLGEPTPYYSARSSYFGIIDLAGFKKDRYYLYQSRWRPDLRMAHILPHWTWPGRTGQVTPVHVFSAADEAELFLNGQSQGRQKSGSSSNYRFRWDKVVYQPGELHVVTYKEGKGWANDTVRTAGFATQIRLINDKSTGAMEADGRDLCFITAQILDDKEVLVPQANDTITFSLDGPGEIVATDNGDPADMVSFASKERKAFSGLALAIVRAKAGGQGVISVTASAKGLQPGTVTLHLE